MGWLRDPHVSQVNLMRLGILWICWKEKLPEATTWKWSTESEANGRKSRAKPRRERQIKFQWHCLSSWIQSCLTLSWPLQVLAIGISKLCLTQGSLNLGFLLLAIRKVLINIVGFASLTYVDYFILKFNGHWWIPSSLQRGENWNGEVK